MSGSGVAGAFTSGLRCDSPRDLRGCISIQINQIEARPAAFRPPGHHRSLLYDGASSPQNQRHRVRPFRVVRPNPYSRSSAWNCLLKQGFSIDGRDHQTSGRRLDRSVECDFAFDHKLISLSQKA
jgi:hypothetical protein